MGCNPELVVKWAGHEFDADVKTSRVDRGYTTYSREYIQNKITSQEKSPKSFSMLLGNSIIKKREKFCEFLSFLWCPRPDLNRHGIAPEGF